MNSELKNTTPGIASMDANIDKGHSTLPNVKVQAEKVSPPTDFDFVDPAKHRQEKIKKLAARLQREIARDNTATRKERNGQLFVWGAMVEGIYRDGNAQERDQLKQWAKRKLTDKRHLQRAQNGFARIEGETTEKADV